MLQFNYNQKIKKCLVCGASAMLLLELSLCHNCIEKFDANPHLIEENGFADSQSLSRSIFSSVISASGVVANLEDQNFTID